MPENIKNTLKNHAARTRVRVYIYCLVRRLVVMVGGGVVHV